MSFVSAEHDRMIAGLVKACYVVAVDLTASPPVCRVSDGEWTSAWVRWHSLAAGKARHWRAPGMGEQGSLISPSGEVSQGTFVPGLYGDAGMAPDNRDHVEAWHFDDGGSLVYDWEAKSYRITLPEGTVAITVGGSTVTVTEEAIEAQAGRLTWKGDVLIEGSLHVTGDIEAAGKIMDAGGNSPNHQH